MRPIRAALLATLLLTVLRGARRCPVTGHVRVSQRSLSRLAGRADGRHGQARCRDHGGTHQLHRPQHRRGPHPPARHHPGRDELPHLRAQPVGCQDPGPRGPHPRQRAPPGAADAGPRGGFHASGCGHRVPRATTPSPRPTGCSTSASRESAGDPNPHLWMNVQYALHYAQLMRDWFSTADPANATYYATNFDRLPGATSTTSTRASTAAVATVPAANRKLLTYHDSWAYWARQYGFDRHRRGPGVGLLGSQPAGRREAHRPDPGPACAGGLRLRGLPQHGAASRSHSEIRGHVHRRAPRRRAARGPEQPRAHLPGHAQART